MSLNAPMEAVYASVRNKAFFACQSQPELVSDNQKLPGACQSEQPTFQKIFHIK